MKLTDLDNSNTPVKALRETFDINLNMSSLDSMKTRTMLTKVRGLINESKRTPQFHQTQQSPSYLKLIFMEQALSNHLKTFRHARIVLENEEVEKSQVILAAQDMIDTVQKMYEDINDMLVKELPALVDSIQSEIGANESESFNQAATDALTALNSSLQETQTSLKNGLGILTGQESMDAFSDETDMDGAEEMDIDSDFDSDLGPEDEAALNEPEMGTEEMPELPEPEEVTAAAAGREKR